MIRLFYFEIRKNFLTKYIFLAFSLFLIINGLLIYKNYIFGDGKSTGYFMPHSADTRKQWEFYRSMHKKLDGDLTIEKANFIIDENNRLQSIVSDGTYSKEYQSSTYTGYFWGDYVMVNKYFYLPMKYISTYSMEAAKIVEKAKDNIAFYERYENKYEKAKNEFIADCYSRRKINIFYDGKPWELLFDYEISDLLILLLMLLGLVPMFVNEKETSMGNLILASRNGKINMAIIKVASALSFVFFLVLVFSCENFLAFKYLYGLNGYGMPLYAIEKYQYSPLTCSVLTFYFMSQLIKTIGLFAFGMFISLLSSLLNRVIYIYLLSSFFMVGSIYTSGYTASVELKKTLLSLFSPFTLLKSNELYSRLVDINFLNNFVLLPNLCIYIQIIIISILFLLLSRSAVFLNLEMSKTPSVQEVHKNGI